MKFALIGAGIIGRVRARTVAEREGVSLVGVADPDEAAARKCADSYGGKAFTNYQDMLAECQPDCVMIASPVHYHEEGAVAAFEAGAHVLCEKPLSNSHESTLRILDGAKKHNRTLAVGFNHRYYPSIEFLTEIIDSGQIGTIDHLRIITGHDGLSNLRCDWMYKKEFSGGGAMLDCGIHMTDLARFIGGEIKEVYGVARNGIWNLEGSEDNAMAIFKTVDNLPISYQATWSEWKGYQFCVEAYGEKGMVKGFYAPTYNLFVSRDPKTGAKKKMRKFYPELILKEKFKGWESTSHYTFVKELDDFLQMIEGKNVRLADGWSGARALEITEAVYRSEETGEVVKLSDPPA